jgi:hypothetical protein
MGEEEPRLGILHGRILEGSFFCRTPRISCAACRCPLHAIVSRCGHFANDVLVVKASWPIWISAT